MFIYQIKKNFHFLLMYPHLQQPYVYGKAFMCRGKIFGRLHWWASKELGHHNKFQCCEIYLKGKKKKNTLTHKLNLIKKYWRWKLIILVIKICYVVVNENWNACMTEFDTFMVENKNKVIIRLKLKFLPTKLTKNIHLRILWTGKKREYIFTLSERKSLNVWTMCMA